MTRKTTRVTWFDLSKKSDSIMISCATCKRPFKSIKLPANTEPQTVRCNDCFWNEIEELNNPVFVKEEELKDGMDQR